MKTIKIKLYSFDELSEEAKEVARDNYRTNFQSYHWASENTDTLKAFEKIFPIRVKNYAVDSFNYYVSIKFLGEEDVENLSGVRLLSYLWNNYKSDLYKGAYKTVNISDKKVNHKRVRSEYFEKTNRWHNAYHSAITLDNCCPLTGYCMDDEILAPIFTFMSKPDNITFAELMQDCVDAWGKACQKDYEWQESDEYIDEEIESNNYDFTEDGKLY